MHDMHSSFELWQVWHGNLHFSHSPALFPTVVEQACELCDSSPTNCFKCASNYSLYNNECIEMYPDGMTSVENTCQHCIPSCKTCSSSPSECTSCQPGLYLHMNQCLEECPNNFFADKENGVCSKCESPCETCDAKNKCITCLEGFNLSSGECVEA